jgi:hypothetical protein
MTKDEVARKIYNTLTGQRFTNWYEGDFISHVSSDEGCPTEEEILTAICRLFHLE